MLAFPVLLTRFTDQDRPVVQGLIAVTLQGWTIPAGFLSDGVSDPRWVSLIDPGATSLGRAFLGAYLHDYLITIGVDRPTRSKAAKAQWLADGVDPATAEIMYLAVLHWPGPETETVERVRPIPDDVRAALIRALSSSDPAHA